MKLTQAIFWDTDYEQIDWDRRATYVIGKVLNYGRLEDWKAIKAYFGWERIKEEVVSIRDLDPKALHFASVVFELPLTKFACYTSKPSIQTPWNS